jgi:hypothetical protein
MSTWRPDERDDLDTTIDGEWRKASREEPPPHVDAAILAAARTRRSRFAAWQPLAAAAAVAGLAFLLVHLLPRERDVGQPILMEPAPPPAAPVEQAVPVARSTMQGATGTVPVAPRDPANESSERARAAEKPAPDLPQEQAESVASRSDAAAGPRQRSKESRADGELAVEAPAQAAATERAAARAESSSPSSPESEMQPTQWATLIETLYGSGDPAAAESQLRAFRREHPDADRYLPEALREWASEVD